ncbi:MAG TPA: glycosyltransferase [Lachnospiraceae bacterium]|nr:glycosyltransferase [Lachnospiraceae bacterium]HPF28590.1 glycosyltransferase [Lachnospiraceae bacterium]
MKELKSIMVIGPVYPYKGGIAHYTGLLSKALGSQYLVDTVSYSLQYPKFMFKKEQKDYGNKTFEIKDARFLINTANPFSWMKMKQEIKKKEPDLLIVQWWHPYFAPCYQWMLHGLKKTKVLFVCHNVLPHERFPMDRILTKNTLKNGNYCILHSKEDEENLKLLLPKLLYERTVLPTYQAFCLQHMTREEARRKLGISLDDKVILFFGLVRKYKGLGYLIAAANRIVTQYPEMKICIVGDFGSSREEYMEQIRNTGVEDHFIIRDGYVPDAEVEPYFAAADLNVCPYETATQSAIVQVAFGFELPVLATRVGGLPEAVTDGLTGYIVEPMNPDAIAEGVIRYFKEEKEEEFRKHVSEEKERFSWDRTVEIIQRLWKAEQE